MKLHQDRHTITVDNGHWAAKHDTAKGGALASVVFHKGRHGNLLSRPLAMGVGSHRDIHETRPEVQVRESEGEIALLFSGALKNASGAGMIRYAQSWVYREYGAHRSQQIYFDAPPDPRELVTMDLGVAGTYRRVLVDASAQKWHDVSREAVHCAVVPATFGFFADTGEGIQFVRGDDISAWGYDDEKRDTVFGDFACGAHGSELAAELRPFKHLPPGRNLLAPGQEGLSFDSFLGITNYKRRPYLPYSEIVLDSQPFPTDAEIKAFYDMGVNVLRIHEGANYINRTGDCWMDGMFPPYEGAQLTEMKRTVKTAHMYGMKVLPYFMPQGVHPLSEAFRNGTNARDWQCREWPDSFPIFSALGDGQVWETYFCLQSPWHNWLFDHVVKIIEEYDFDGFYFDSLPGPRPCFHPGHGRVPHGREDATIRLLLALRQRLPGKVIFHHQMSVDVNVIHANLVDHIINLEEHGYDLPEALRPLPFGATVQRACASIGPVPQPFLSKDGEAVSPGLAMVKYKPGKEPTPTRTIARRGLPYVIVHGVLPYLYTFMEHVMVGYHTSRDRLEDKEGFYYFYSLLKCLRDYDVQEYYAPAEQALTSETAGIYAATMTTADGLILLVTSTNAKTFKDVVIEPSAEYAEVLRSQSWKSAELLAGTRPVGVSVVHGKKTMKALMLDDVPPNELWIIKVT